MSNIYALCMHLEWQQVMQAAVLHIWIIGEVFVFHQHMSVDICYMLYCCLPGQTESWKVNLRGLSQNKEIPVEGKYGFD